MSDIKSTDSVVTPNKNYPVVRYETCCEERAIELAKEHGGFIIDAHSHFIVAVPNRRRNE